MLNFKVDPTELYNGRPFLQMDSTELLDAYEELADDADLADEDDGDDEIELLSRYAKCRAEIVRRIEAARDLNHAVAEYLAGTPAASPVAGVSEVELLAVAIVDIAIAAGITKGELPMTGSEVLTLAKEIEHFVAQPSAEGDDAPIAPAAEGLIQELSGVLRAYRIDHKYCEGELRCHECVGADTAMIRAEEYRKGAKNGTR